MTESPGWPLVESDGHVSAEGRFIPETVRPSAEVAQQAILHLVEVLNNPEAVPASTGINSVAAAVALLNAYTALRTFKLPTLYPAPEDRR